MISPLICITLNIVFYSFGFAHIGRVGSVFATLMVTIERFVAVWCPLKRLKSTKTLLSISIIGSLIYNIPRFLEFESTTEYVSKDKSQILLDQSEFDNANMAMYFNNSYNLSQVCVFCCYLTMSMYRWKCKRIYCIVCKM